MEDEFLYGIRLFNERKFFDCHEVLEEIWRPDRTARRLFLQGLIHLAVAFHHAQNGNRRGAGRQLRKGLRKLAGYLPVCEGIDTGALYRAALNCFDELERTGGIASFPNIEFAAR
jgi:predicted metal-dependent hydrolase